MARIETWFEQDLQKPVSVRVLTGNLFSMDNQGNLIGVKVLDGGEAATLSGTVSGNVIRQDGGTVAVSGTLSGNQASIVLPQAAYAVPGLITITIKLTSSSVVTTLAALTAVVYRTSTDVAVDPGTLISDINTLIAAIDTAVASIPADYSSLWTSLAPAFSTSTAYMAGQYVTYNGGLYRFTTDHAAGSWNSAHVTATKLGPDIADLKSALDKVAFNGNDNLINLTDFTNPYTGTSYVVDQENQTITVSTTSSGKWRSVATPTTFVTERLDVGKHYRLHIKAEPVSGSPYIEFGVRGIAGNADAMYAGSAGAIKSGGDYFVDFIADKDNKSVVLFITYSTTASASVKFSDIWLIETADNSKYVDSRYFNFNNMVDYKYQDGEWVFEGDGLKTIRNGTTLYVNGTRTGDDNIYSIRMGGPRIGMSVPTSQYNDSKFAAELKNGHTYELKMKLLSGSFSQGTGTNIPYAQCIYSGSQTSAGPITRDGEGNTNQRFTVSQDNVSAVVWWRCYKGNTFTDAVFDITLIDLTEAEESSVPLQRMRNFEAKEPNSTTSGYLKRDGTINTSYGGVIGKFTVPESTEWFALDGAGSLTPGTNNHWCYVWFVVDGSMSSYIESEYSPQEFTLNGAIKIPSGTEEIWVSNIVTNFGNLIYFIKDGLMNIPKELHKIDSQIDEISSFGKQWDGKKWYAYGTSITNVSNEGKYATYLAQMSGMTLYNKGISGGGIGDLGGYSHGQVYNAICNTTDGKTEADLITLETGANDTGASVPLGTIYDTGRDTLAGCLNDCLRYLQENTDAQIAVTVSPATTTEPNALNQYYEWAAMIEKICHLNRVHFLNNDNNMGYAKISDETKGSLYVVDNIHQTSLGGYIMAQNLWYQLRNIPLFYTSIPS